MSRRRENDGEGERRVADRRVLGDETAGTDETDGHREESREGARSSPVLSRHDAGSPYMRRQGRVQGTSHRHSRSSSVGGRLFFDDQDCVSIRVEGVEVRPPGGGSLEEGLEEGAWRREKSASCLVMGVHLDARGSARPDPRDPRRRSRVDRLVLPLRPPASSTTSATGECAPRSSSGTPSGAHPLSETSSPRRALLGRRGCADPGRVFEVDPAAHHAPVQRGAGPEDGTLALVAAAALWADGSDVADGRRRPLLDLGQLLMFSDLPAHTGSPRECEPARGDLPDRPSLDQGDDGTGREISRPRDGLLAPPRQSGPPALGNGPPRRPVSPRPVGCGVSGGGGRELLVGSDRRSVRTEKRRAARPGARRS